jgi:glycosyltransferase involved in cell wall biosynthesis
MKNKNITFIIFTYNEVHRIEYPIKCVLDYGDVLVVDNFSTDGTSELAKKLGARVFQRDNSVTSGIVECKEEADKVLPHVYTDWVYWGFADELIPKECLKRYCEIANGSHYKVVVQKLKTMLYKSEMEFHPANTVIKFFKVGALDFLPFGQFIHGIGPYASHVKKEEIFFLPPIEEYSIHHFSVYNTEKLITNHNRYSTVHANFINKKYINTKILLEPLINFFIIYFYQRAFKHGILGFIVAIEYSYYSFVVNVKAHEKYNKITLAGIESNFKIKKEIILFELPKSTALQKFFARLKIFFFSQIYIYKHFYKNIK